MMNRDDILKEANEYLNGQNTMAEVASSFHISKRSLQIHFQKLKEIDFSLYQLVLQKKKSNQMAGRKIGGEIGKRGPSYTKEEALKIAEEIIHHQLTYEEASLLFQIPTSTIYDMVHSSYVDSSIRASLDEVADSNRRKIPFDGGYFNK